jgi:tight adherence protein C
VLLLLTSVLLIVATYLALDAVSVRSRQLKAQLDRAANYATLTDSREEELDASANERLLKPMIKRMSEMMLRVSPQNSRLEMAKKIQAAGMATPPQTIYAVKGGLIGGGLLLGIVAAMVLHKVGIVPIGLMIAAIGYIGPERYLAAKATRRRNDMERMLPDTLDLLTVSVEAGLGFDSAIAKVCEKMRGPLIDELAIMAQEIRVGETRREALRNLGIRSHREVVQTFARSIIQAEELGTSLGRTLRVQAVDMRIKRQLTAEEKAMKAPVKMLFPTVLFIFPAMFDVILGPAFLNIMANLKDVAH